MTKTIPQKINPLNFYGIRKLQVPPPHFEYLTIEMSRYNLEQTIIKWIEQNLKGRFYVGAIYELDKNNKQSKVIKIGFEEPKELSFFTLSCPYLKY
jgi:predicted secreted protein